MSRVCSVVRFLFGYIIQFFVNVRFKIAINNVSMFAFDAFCDFIVPIAVFMFNFAIVGSRIVLVEIIIRISSIARNVIAVVKKYEEISAQSSSSASKTEKKENRMAVDGGVQTRKFSNFVAVIARFIGFGWFINIAIAFIESFGRQLRRGSIRKQQMNGNAQSTSSSSVVREVRWSRVVRRRSLNGPMVVLAISVISSMLAGGDGAPIRREVKQTKVDTDATRFEFFDAGLIQRGAPTMGGSIKMKVAFICGSKTGLKLFDEGNTLLGEGTCIDGGTQYIKFNVTDKMVIGQFKIDNEDVVSNLFDSKLRFILVKRPWSMKKCESGKVYAKHDGGTGCFQLIDAVCDHHNDKSSKVGCPGAVASYCGAIANKKPETLSETNQIGRNPCKGNVTAEIPRLDLADTPKPNHGWIKMTKTDKLFVGFSKALTSPVSINTTYHFEGKPISTYTIEDSGSVREQVPSQFFENPGKVVRECIVTIDGQEFRMVHDLFYMETDMAVDVKAKCKKDGVCTIDASGDLVVFLKQNDFIGGLTIDGKEHETFLMDNVRNNSIVSVWYGRYTWDGQDYVNGTTLPIVMSVTAVIETTTTGERTYIGTSPLTWPWSTRFENTTKGSNGDKDDEEEDEKKKKKKKKPKEPESLSWLAIGGIILGVILVIAIVIALPGIVLIRRRRKQKEQQQQPDKDSRAQQIVNAAPLHPESDELSKGNKKTNKEFEKMRDHGNHCKDVERLQSKERSAKKIAVPQSRYPDHETYEENRVKPLNATKMPDTFGHTLIISQAPLSSETYVFVKILHESDIGVLVIAVEFGELIESGTEDTTKAWQWFPIKSEDPSFCHDDPNDKNKKLSVALLGVNPLVGKPMEKPIEIDKKTTKKKIGEKEKPPPKPFSLIQYTVQISDGTTVKVIEVLHLSGFDDNNYNLDANDVKTLSMTAVRTFDLQRDAKDNERGVWIHCLAGKERSPIVATLFMMWQMILKTRGVNVEGIMHRVRRYRLGAFCAYMIDDTGKTSMANMTLIWFLLHDIAKQMLIWRKERKLTMESVRGSTIPTIKTTAKTIKTLLHPDTRVVDSSLRYQVIGHADESEKSKVEASGRGGTSSIKPAAKSMPKSISKSTIAKSVGKSNKPLAMSSSKIAKSKKK